MNPEEEMLKSDFSQCFAQMRHYDSHCISMINFIFGGYAAVVVAVFSFLIEEPITKLRLVGIFALFTLAWTAGSLLLTFLVRNRVSFISAARYVNEIRGKYLQTNPLGVENKTGMPTSFDKPLLFNPRSTHMTLMYFVALFNSIFLASSLFTFMYAVKVTLEITIVFSLVSFIISTYVSIMNVIRYLKKRNNFTAMEAWWGENG
jgi:hypothetical protein